MLILKIYVMLETRANVPCCIDLGCIRSDGEQNMSASTDVILFSTLVTVLHNQANFKT